MSGDIRDPLRDMSKADNSAHDRHKQGLPPSSHLQKTVYGSQIKTFSFPFLKKNKKKQTLPPQIGMYVMFNE
jgi:hypothetical protein